MLCRFITTISAWSEIGCKNAKEDPHAKALGDDYVNGLGGWCATKKAGAVFFWMVFGQCAPVHSLCVAADIFRLAAWVGTVSIVFRDWRKGRSTRPRDPPFEHPEVDDGDEESTYEVVPHLKRDADSHSDSPFSDAYRYSGASSTVVDSSAGYGSPGKYSIPSAPQPRPSLDAYGAFSDPTPTGFAPPPNDNTGISRTMQYADPYAAVRASVASAPNSSSTYQ